MKNLERLYLARIVELAMRNLPVLPALSDHGVTRRVFTSPTHSLQFQALLALSDEEIMHRVIEAGDPEAFEALRVAVA